MHYYISSLDLAQHSPDAILALIRNHWSVENSLHLVKDRWRDEDKHYLARKGVGENFTCLLNKAIGIAEMLKKKNEPLTAVNNLVRDKPRISLKLLGFLN
jgi:predicted transposase YbfD/YdcC